MGLGTATCGELVLGEGILASAPPTLVEDARYRTKVYLEAYLDESKLLHDDDATPAAFAVMYAYPNYPLTLEFFHVTDPVDLLFLIGKPNSTALLQGDQTAWGYREHVPITISCVDKTGITGTILLWKAEAELRRITEEHPLGSQRSLKTMGDDELRLGSTVIYQAKYIVNYQRNLT